MLGVLFFWSFSASAGEAILSWNPNPPSDGVMGYNIYYRTSTGSYGPPINAGNVVTYTVTGLTEGLTYYFALTAYDGFNNESGKSLEQSKFIPVAGGGGGGGSGGGGGGCGRIQTIPGDARAGRVSLDLAIVALVLILTGVWSFLKRRRTVEHGGFKHGHHGKK
jgi:hypothetical protein